MNASLKSMLRTVMIILAVIVLTACGADNTANNASNNASSEKGLPLVTQHPDAIELYRTHCIVCHGNALEGKVGELSNLQTVGARLSRDEIVETISDGRNLMPDFKDRLSQEEIALLSDWLSEVE